MVISCQFSSLPRQELSFVFPKTFLEHHKILVLSYPPCLVLPFFWLWHIAAIVSAIRNLSPACGAAGENSLTWAFPGKTQQSMSSVSVARLIIKWLYFFIWAGPGILPQVGWISCLAKTFNFVLNSVCLGGNTAYSDQGREGRKGKI